LNLEVHRFENSSLSFFVLLLGKCFLGVALVAIQVRNIFIKFRSFSRNNESWARPKSLILIFAMKTLVDI